MLDPIDEPNDVWVEGEMVFSRCNAEKIAPLFVAHRTLQAPRKQRQLFVRGYRSCGWRARSSFDARSPFTDRFSFAFGTTVRP